MALRVGINGLGRIGRLTLRNWATRHRDAFTIVAANDLADATTAAHLTAFDSAYGAFPGRIESGPGTIAIDGHELRVTSERDPAAIPWGDAGVEVVIDATGKFRDRAAAGSHLRDGVRKVLISANGRNEDLTIIYGVNHDAYDPASHHIISAGSCTTNCVTPLAKVLLDRFGIRGALLTTVHAITNGQSLLDSAQKDLRRARTASESIIPTTTGASDAVAKALPALAGKIDGMALRVPTASVSIVDLVTQLERPASVEEINDAVAEAAATELHGILHYETRELVSVDFKQHDASSIFDAPLTRVLDSGLTKTLAWYDNEWGYVSRLTDICALFAERGIS
ncbi:MAG: type I glyceraldehyde-3-phosphate dehydrogenase [Dehalococcoidia bacterium]